MPYVVALFLLLSFAVPLNIQAQGQFELDHVDRENQTLSFIHWRLREIERIGGLRDQYRDLLLAQTETFPVGGNTVAGKLVSVEAYVEFEGERCLNVATREFDFRVERLMRMIMDAGQSDILATSPEGNPLDTLPVDTLVHLTYKTHFGLGGTVESVSGRYGSFLWRIEGIIGARGFVQEEVVTEGETLAYTFPTHGLFRVKAQGLVESEVFRQGEIEVGTAREFIVGLCGDYPPLDITYVFDNPS